MKTILLASLFLTITSYAAVLDGDYYPEERVYDQTNPADRGYRQYGTPSLHQKGEFVLTYDDGPHLINTPVLLDQLKTYQAPATFFLVMERVGPKSELLIKRMIEEGHIVGVHSMHHLNSNTMDKATFKADTKEAILKLHNVYKKLGKKLEHIYFRFPFAAYAENTKYHHLNAIRELSYEMYGDNCIQFVFWDHDSTDWVPSMSVQDIVNNLMSFYEGGEYITFKTVRTPQGVTYEKVYTQVADPLKGGTILMHDIHERTIKASLSYLEFTKNNGLKIVPLDETIENKPKENQKCELKISR